MTEFEIFHWAYLITISAISVIFIIQVFLSKTKDIRDVTFDDYFREWWDHHGMEGPIEEVKGPLRPYLKAFFVVGKPYARLMTANQVSVLGFLWALWTLECWFLGGGWILLGAIFVTFSATTDSIDGVVAFLTGTESNKGAYYDAILDKFADILWVLGPLYFIFTQAPYTPFWISVVAILGMAGLLLAIIQEYCRARQQGLGLVETKAVVGERIMRLFAFIVLSAAVGLSSILTTLNPIQSWIDINVWINTYIIPICFIALIALAVISLIQINKHGIKNLK